MPGARGPPRPDVTDLQRGIIVAVRGPFHRVRLGLAALILVLGVGIVGFLVLGLSPLNAVYHTVLTITTVGQFNAAALQTRAAKVFTIVLVLVGVGTALYTFSAVLEVLIEGHMQALIRRRRMEREIAAMTGHTVVCGLGRVGQEVARFLAASGKRVVAVDRDESRLADVPCPSVHGEATDDDVLLQAGIQRAGALVAALDTDADNLFVTLACRAMRPDLQIIARARNEASEPKLRRAGADRVVNPQQLGGDRMAAFVTQPHVVEFMDVVMHDNEIEFRLEQFVVPVGSSLAGQSLRSARVRDRSGALVLALRRPGGDFVTNPAAETEVGAGDVMIGIGTRDQLERLGQMVGSAGGRPAGVAGGG